MSLTRPSYRMCQWIWQANRQMMTVRQFHLLRL